MSEHWMLPGSHERMDGPECRCGAAWSWWDDCCVTELDRKKEGKA